METNFYADQLSIETPEQVDLRFPVAGIGSRFVAVLIDHLIQLVPYVLLLIAAALWADGPATKAEMKAEGSGNWALAIFIFVNFLWIWGYFTLFEAFWNGRTPGKYVMKLRVIKDAGRSITFFEAMARNVVRFVDLFPSMYFIGVISMFCTRQNKRLGDMLAGTLVVHESRTEQPTLRYAESETTQSFTPQAQAARMLSEAQLPADAVSKLKPDDLHVIETFFARVLDLNMETRAQLAERLAERMTARMQVSRPARMDAERLLELIAFRMRSTGRG